MGLCQQKQYTTFKDDKPKHKNNNNFYLDEPIFKKKQEDTFSKYFEQQEKKKQAEAKNFEDYFKQQQRKQKESDKKLTQFFNSNEAKKKRHPSDTQMAKVLYAYMRHYGSIPNEEIKKFIEDNYNSSYCSQVYRLNSTTPIYTYKSQVIDRLKTANNNSMISFHQTFRKADEEKRTIEYEWIVRNQLTNYMTVYDCEATFDDQYRFLKLVMRENDRMNHKPLPPEPPKISKPSYQTSTYNNYGGPSTDWGAYYNAQTQQSNAEFRERMNNQARDWNNYAQQKNARGW